MRVGIDIRNIGKKRTGDETVFFNLVKNLAQIDGTNEYFLLTDILDGNVLAGIKEKLGILDKKNFKVVSLKSGNKFIWNLFTLAGYLEKNPVDVYHTQYIVPFFVPKKIKIITHIHDVSFIAYPELISKIDIFFLKLLIPRSLRLADKIISVSEFTKQEIIKYYNTDPEKIEIVYNAANDNFSKDESPEKLEEVRKKYSLPKKFALYVGTMQPRKNIPMLINAFFGIKDKISGTKLVLVGNKNAHNFDNNINKSISDNNIKSDVIFPGYIDQEDLAAIYKLAEVFVFPSLYEGFGIPILEAFASKLPVLASDIQIHNEIAGEAALYFNPGSLDDFSEKLYNSLADQNLREKLISSGSERINFFSWQRSAQEMLKIYEELIGR